MHAYMTEAAGCEGRFQRHVRLIEHCFTILEGIFDTRYMHVMVKQTK